MHDQRIAAQRGANGSFAAPGDTGTAKSDARKLVRTGTPGIYRKGTRYVVVYKAAGRQRKEFRRCAYHPANPHGRRMSVARELRRLAEGELVGRGLRDRSRDVVGRGLERLRARLPVLRP
jgi:hypothetical protein